MPIQYAMTFGQMKALTLLMAGDPEGEKYRNEDVERSVNDAICAFSVFSQAKVETARIQLQAYQAVISLRDEIQRKGSLCPMAHPLRMVYEDVNGAAVPIFATDHMALAGESRIQSAQGVLGWRFDVVDFGMICIFPVPQVTGSADVENSLTGNIAVQYAAMPMSMLAGNNDVTTIVPHRYHEVICSRAAAFLLETGDEEDLALAMQLSNEFSMAHSRAAGSATTVSSFFEGVSPL